jgi:hypothetical protein
MSFEKKDVNNKWRTYSLFWEHRQKGYDYYWTLKDKGTEELPSLKEIYMSYRHAPEFEYEFAQEVIGSWPHWQKLCRSGLKNYIAAWREELDVKLKAEAIRGAINVSKEGESDSSRLQANKWLADKGYAPTRGRPSKLEKAQKLAQDAAVSSEIEDDLARVGLKAVK